MLTITVTIEEKTIEHIIVELTCISDKGSTSPLEVAIYAGLKDTISEYLGEHSERLVIEEQTPSANTLTQKAEQLIDEAFFEHHRDIEEK